MFSKINDSRKFLSQVSVTILSLAILLAFVLYYPGLAGPLLFDDFHVLTNNKLLNISSLDLGSLIQAMESFNGDGRQFSMLSFAFNLYFLGESTWWLKCVNVIIHCLNGILLFFVASKTVEIIEREGVGKHTNLRLLPAIAVALWLISPINLTSVLYISQRMTLLSSFFVLAGLLAYISARITIKQASRKALYIPLLIAFFTALGYLCKENAALLPLFIAIVEITVFQFKSDKRLDKVIVYLYFAGAVLVLAGLIYLVLGGSDWPFGGYEFREFTPIERIMTQFRALAFYLSQILIPSNTALSLWHDDFGISTGLLSPPTTLMSMVLIFILVVLAVMIAKKSPVLTMGIMWFFVAHSMESTILPLELVHEHRNYLASFGILLCITYLVLKISAVVSRIRLVMYFMLVSLFMWNTHVLGERAHIWSDNYRLAQHGASTHPESYIANFELARLQYLRFYDGEKEFGARAKDSYLKARALEPNQIIVELTMMMASEDGAFEYDPKWLETAIDKFPNAPKTPPLESAVISLLECLNWQRCTKSSKDVHKLFDLFRESNNLYFVNLYALYYWRIDYRPGKAEPAFEYALQGTDARFWTYYLEYLLDKKKLDVFCTKYPEFKIRLDDLELENISARLSSINNINRSFTNCPVNL